MTLEALHRQHAAAVRAYALRRTAEPADADEACAEVWVIAWRQQDRIPAEALPWLLGVARRVLANQRRGERRRLALGRRLAFERPPPVRTDADPVLGEALDRLCPADREALLLIAWEGLSSAQAAAVVGVRPQTFAVRLHRARTRLAAGLKRAGVHPFVLEEAT